MLLDYSSGDISTDIFRGLLEQNSQVLFIYDLHLRTWSILSVRLSFCLSVLSVILTIIILPLELHLKHIQQEIGVLSTAWLSHADLDPEGPRSAHCKTLNALISISLDANKSGMLICIYTHACTHLYTHIYVHTVAYMYV